MQTPSRPLARAGDAAVVTPHADSATRFAFLRTTAFRWIIASASVFAGAFAIMFGFIYWQTAGQMGQQLDRLLAANAETFATQSRPALLRHLHDYLALDLRQMQSAGLFDAAGHPVAGNLRAIPPALPPSGQIGTTMIRRINPMGTENVERARATLQRTPDGYLLVLARNMDQIQRLTRLITRALLLGAGPAVLLALAGGMMVSLGRVRRLEAIHAASRRIMAGQLGERLPVGRSRGDFDKLAGIVNTMLDEIERLMNEVKSSGDAIAHDLRTPLARLRSRLERARDNETRQADDLRADIDGAIGHLDELIHTIQALLRLGAIEQGQRQAAFAPLDLADTAREVGELFAPMADDRGVALTVDAVDGCQMLGDRGLLFEALVNLVDNAVKFTPAGGHVQIATWRTGGCAMLSVTDDGPGIPPSEREAVLRRFFRSDRSRTMAGSGLGLSLVAAIARLHGCQLAIDAAPGMGCRMTLSCPGIATDGHDASDAASGDTVPHRALALHP